MGQRRCFGKEGGVSLDKEVYMCRVLFRSMLICIHIARRDVLLLVERMAGANEMALEFAMHSARYYPICNVITQLQYQQEGRGVGLACRYGHP